MSEKLTGRAKIRDSLLNRYTQSVGTIIVCPMQRATPASTQKYPINAKYPPTTGRCVFKV